MKNIILTILLVISSKIAFAQVNFLKGSYKDAFKAAKEQNKPLFVELFSPSCHVCQSFMPVFDSKEIGFAINPLMISYKLDVNSTEMAEFEKTYKVFAPSLPLMLFFNPDGSFMHHGILGENQGGDEVKKILFTALDPKRRSSVYKSEFLKGNKETNFLIEYGMLTKIQKDTVTNLKVTSTLFNAYNKNELNNRTSWLILYKLVLDVDNGFFKHWIKNLATAQQHSSGQTADVMENIIFSSLYSKRGELFNSQKINVLKGYLKDLGRSTDDANRMTILPEAKALMNEGKSENAAINVDNYFKKGTPSTSEISYILKLFNDTAKDANYFKVAKNWLQTGAKSNKGHRELAALHFESARLHQRANLNADAKKAAKMAYSEATIAKISLQKFENLYRSFK